MMMTPAITDKETGINGFIVNPIDPQYEVTEKKILLIFYLNIQKTVITIYLVIILLDSSNEFNDL